LLGAAGKMMGVENRVGRKEQSTSIRDRLFFRRHTKRRRRRSAGGWNWIGALKLILVIGVLVGTGGALRYAEGYVEAQAPQGPVPLLLVDVPGWVDWDLKARVAAVAGGSEFPVRPETAETLARNLAPMAWLDDVQVRVTRDAVRVHARWRKPVALLERGPTKFYVDPDLVVLDYMPMSHLPIVKVDGVAMALAPAPGQVFDRDDLAAAVVLIDLLQRMDAEVVPDKPLLDQLASIDVSNYRGRRSRHRPHLVLYAKDGTQIIWGAEFGEWGKHLEATDEQKLAKLYTHYEEFGFAGGPARYINLCDPQDRVPQPIDKYRR